MQPTEQSSQQLAEGTSAQAPQSQEEPEQPLAAPETPSQPLRPPKPYAARPRLTQPLPPQEPLNGLTPPRRLPRLTPKQRAQLLWALGGVIAVVLMGSVAGIVIVAASSKNLANTGASHPTAVSTSAAITTPTQPGAEYHQVGETISTPRWQVTINSASAYAGNANRFEVPAAGDTFLVVEGTFKNPTSTMQLLSTLQFFTLQDVQGNVYTEAFFNSLRPPDGVVFAGDTARGKWGYEVPASIHTFLLIYSDDAGQTTSTWEISI